MTEMGAVSVDGSAVTKAFLDRLDLFSYMVNFTHYEPATSALSTLFSEGICTGHGQNPTCSRSWKSIARKTPERMYL